jgi:hypothetical protein
MSAAAAGAGRRAFGARWFAKLGLISFTAGGLMEFAMIKSGFCTQLHHPLIFLFLLFCVCLRLLAAQSESELISGVCELNFFFSFIFSLQQQKDEAVVATSSAPDWQNSWQEVGAEVQRQLREKSERGDIVEPTRVERVLQQLEARYQQQLDRDQPPSPPAPAAADAVQQQQQGKESEDVK